MVERTYTSAEIQAGMSSALRAGDMKAVVGLLHLLATVDPASAQMLVGSIEYLNSQELHPTDYRQGAPSMTATAEAWDEGGRAQRDFAWDNDPRNGRSQGRRLPPNPYRKESQ